MPFVHQTLREDTILQKHNHQPGPMPLRNLFSPAKGLFFGRSDKADAVAASKGKEPESHDDGVKDIISAISHHRVCSMDGKADVTENGTAHLLGRIGLLTEWLRDTDTSRSIPSNGKQVSSDPPFRQTASSGAHRRAYSCKIYSPRLPQAIVSATSPPCPCAQVP